MPQMQKEAGLGSSSWCLRTAPLNNHQLLSGSARVGRQHEEWDWVSIPGVLVKPFELCLSCCPNRLLPSPPFPSVFSLPFFLFNSPLWPTLLPTFLFSAPASLLFSFLPLLSLHFHSSSCSRSQLVIKHWLENRKLLGTGNNFKPMIPLLFCDVCRMSHQPWKSWQAQVLQMMKMTMVSAYSLFTSSNQLQVISDNFEY